MADAPKATSEIEIINQALRALGQRAIGAITEDNEAAKLAKLTFAQYREAEMSGFSWNFCTKYAQCPKAGVPVGTFGWATAFTLPPDTLAVRNVENESDLDGDEWTREGDLILTNIVTDDAVETLNIRYTWENLSVPTWDSQFIDVLVARCVFDWSEPLRASSTHSDRSAKKYEDRKGKAKHADSIQGSGTNFVTSRYIAARR